jgi:hypothetical protein
VLDLGAVAAGVEGLGAVGDGQAQRPLEPVGVLVPDGNDVAEAHGVVEVDQHVDARQRLTLEHTRHERLR